ncbi:MAG: gliding motility-associated C-terminal domain-containing protein [Bacteroidales bacterium]|nr:gliding motility-associated C-terminal domain-containing protein [Bacteroidales bacterium]
MKKIWLIVILFISYLSVTATHQRAGEITFRHLEGLTYEVTILTYTFAPSPADRPELEIRWGDGTSTVLPRTEKVDLSNDIRRNVYVGVHTYSGASTYIISLEDPNRNYGVLNIPNSVNIPLYIETKLVINPFLGPNNSPFLLNPPLDNGCVGFPYIHNPGAYDMDGDSLSYKFVVCRGANGDFIPGYVYPNVADPGNPPGDLSINPYTGDIRWDSPTMQGEYNLAMLIEEWRNGVLISSIIRDMQIQIAACDNTPPVIEPLSDTCVIAGSTITFDVVATDEDEDDVVTLVATGGPLVMENNPADFPQPIDSVGHVTSTFTWNTVCSHVQKQPYQVYFKAFDDGYPVQLIDIKTVNILVNGPAPESLTALPIGNSIYLEWNKSTCTNAIGYKVFRRFGPSGFEPGYCETGIPPDAGFTQIVEISSINDTNFFDNNSGIGLISGLVYCYRVIAFYPDRAESYASNEACASLKKDIPIITHVSVEATDVYNGEIKVVWSKPTEMDIIVAPGPYKYLIHYADDFWGSNLMLIDSLADLNDTIYYHGSINTMNLPSSYRIDLYNDEPGNRFLVGSTQIASSLFLSLAPSDNMMMLDIEYNAPWVNDTFVIYRENPNTQEYDSIGWSTNPAYHDSALINGKNYCYLVKGIGNYSSPGIIDPIVNYSQIACGKPRDNVPPCPPELFITTDCNRIANILTWTNPNNYCADDVEKYYIYYTSLLNSDMYILDSLLSASETSYVHANLTSIAGCYAVTAIDSAGNQSDFSNIVCVSIDSCSLYSLPNVFTPNGDGYNDYFVPFPYTSVDKIDLTIFNRWGSMVYETNDPEINWDGENEQTNQDCTEGVYFYVCEVYEITLEGPKKRTIQGSIHLLR